MVAVATVDAPVHSAVIEPVGVIVATVVGVIDHVPPETELNTVVVAHWQIDNVPAIGPGVLFTVTTTVLLQPVGVCVYVIACVPTERPVIIPVVVIPHTGPDVLKEPGIDVLLTTTLVPTQRLNVPVIGFGLAITVNGAVRIQPNGEVSVIVAVPAEPPVITPEVE